MRVPGGRNTWIAFLLILAAYPLDHAKASTQTVTSTSLSKRTPTSQDPYCGVFCLYAYLELIGRHTDFHKLAGLRYVRSRNGSSLLDLRNAARDSGVQGVPLRNISKRFLAKVKVPIILHCKAEATSAKYNHSGPTRHPFPVSGPSRRIFFSL
jgi:hypothetical protein